MNTQNLADLAALIISLGFLSVILLRVLHDATVWLYDAWHDTAELAPREWHDISELRR